MTLIFKSLIRTVKKRPLQPIILVLTLSLAVAITIFTISMHGSMLKETEAAQTAEYGTADVTVKLDGGSRSRFLFAKRAEELLGDGTRAAGVFELPMVTSGRESTVLAAAVEFSDIGEIFSFSFTEYITPTVSEVSDTVFISSSLAERMSLSLGDTLDVALFGGQKVYTVRGISPSLFLGRYEALADISGVVGLMTEDSAILSALGSDFKPSSTVYIDLPEGADINNAIDSLKASPDFSDKRSEVVAGIMKLQANEDALSVLIKVSVSLSLLLAGAVVFSCLYVLSGERREVNDILKSAGARPRALNLIQYAEVAVYHVIASVIGIPLSVPIISLLRGYAGFVYAPPVLTALSAIRGVILTFFVAIFTVTVFVLSPSMTRGVKRGRCERPVLTLSVLIIALIAAVCAFLVPVSLSLIFYIVATVSTVAFIFLGVPFIIVRTVSLLDRLLDTREGHVPLKYALKNLMALRVLHNTSRLVALLVGVLLSISALLVSAVGFTNTVNGLLTSEIAVMNATDRCYDAVEDLDSVADAYRLHMSSVPFYNDDVFMISTDDKRALAEYLNIEELPTGSSALISSGEAAKYSISIGDEINVKIADSDISLTVTGIIKAGLGVIIFESDHFGISPNLILVSGKEGASRSEIIGDLTEAVGEELSPVIETSELFRARMRNVVLYLRASVILISVLVIFALIGLADNLSESHRSRKEERALYITAGVSERDVRKMRSIELAAVFCFGIVIGIIAALFVSAVLSRATLAFGYELIINAKRLF